MASVHSTIAPQSFLSLSKRKSTHTIPHSKSMPSAPNFLCSKFSHGPVFSRNKRKGNWVVVNTAVEECDVIPVQSGDSTDQEEGMVVSRVEMEGGEGELATQVSGFVANEGRLSFEGAGEFQGFSSSSASVGDESRTESEDMERLLDRTINATIVLAAGTFAITKLLTIDSDYWHGWTLFEILRYAPQHNWSAYEEALKTNPVLAKMVISGVVYSIGDWIAQCFEGKPLFEFDRTRMFRSGLVGFTLHGSLSHYYYEFCEALFPFQDWWVVPAKVAFDQTAWAAVWNSIYYTVVAFLRLESPITVFNELKATFWPMLTVRQLYCLSYCISISLLSCYNQTLDLFDFSLHAHSANRGKKLRTIVQTPFLVCTVPACSSQKHQYRICCTEFNIGKDGSTLEAGWKLWPFAHLITYGVIPVEQRLLWVDCVELIWVTILSTYSNEKSEARNAEAPAEVQSTASSVYPPEE